MIVCLDNESRWLSRIVDPKQEQKKKRVYKWRETIREHFHTRSCCVGLQNYNANSVTADRTK